MSEPIPLTLIHGWGMHGGIWANLAERLRADGLTVSAPDLPGYADQPAVTPYELETVAQALLQRWPAQADVCGWSLGGLVALTIARLAPERVRRLVLVGSTPCFVARANWPCGMDAHVFAQFADELDQAYEATLKRFLALQVQGDPQSRAALTVLRQQLFARGRPDTSVLRAGLRLLVDSDVRPWIPHLAMPTLVVQGGYDQLVPACAGQWLAKHLPNANLALLPKATHAPFLSHEGEFDTLLRSFLY